MSSYGTRTTQLFHFTLDRTISLEGRKLFIPHVELFVRVWTWEFTAMFSPSRKQRGFAFYRWGLISIPHVGRIEWTGPERYPRHNYSGDYTEYSDMDRKDQA